MIPIAARSFTLPPGFKYSSLAKISPLPAGSRRRKWSMGVSPTSSVMFSATRRQALDEIGTLQVTEWNARRSMELGVRNDNHSPPRHRDTEESRKINFCYRNLTPILSKDSGNRFLSARKQTPVLVIAPPSPAPDSIRCGYAR